MAAPGGITQIEGFDTTLFIEGLARFAVDEYNKKQNALVLEFTKVLNAKQQPELVFDITLEAFDHTINKNHKYVAKVSLKKELTAFNEVRA